MGYLKDQILHIYRGTLKMESHEPSCGIIPKTKDHAENGSFSVGTTNFSTLHQE